MKVRITLALIAAWGFVSQALANETYKATWWNGAAWNGVAFVPNRPAIGRPPLLERTTWKAEQSQLGTIIRVEKGYLTVDDKGLVHVSAKPTAGSYWLMKEANTERGTYNARDDWR